MLVVSRSELTALQLNPADGFLLGFVDNTSNLEAIVDMSGFSASDVLSAFAKLLKRGVIVFR